MKQEQMLHALFASLVLTFIAACILFALSVKFEIHSFSYLLVAWATSFVGTIVGVAKD
jgi:hypothetical protein